MLVIVGIVYKVLFAMFKCYQFVGFQFTSFSIKPVIENRINGLQIFGKEEQKEREEKWEREGVRFLLITGFSCQVKYETLQTKKPS